MQMVKGSSVRLGKIKSFSLNNLPTGKQR